MMFDRRGLVVGVLVTLAACGSNGGGGVAEDSGTSTDRGPADTGIRADGGADAGRDAGVAADLGPTTASNTCADDEACGELFCDTDVGGGFCSAECTDNPSQPNERQQCGGNNATCLTLGDDDDATSFCARACVPSARTGTPNACPTGRVCTGWWYTHNTGEPDSPGCDAFCATNADCGGMACNPRTGYCGEALDMARLADGEPCNPQMRTGTPAANRQCRGECFQVGDLATQGQCASHINLAVTRTCPDNPTAVQPEAALDQAGEPLDNIALCLFKTCTTNADCASPMTCVAGEDGDPSYCEYP